MAGTRKPYEYMSFDDQCLTSLAIVFEYTARVTTPTTNAAAIVCDATRARFMVGVTETQSTARPAACREETESGILLGD
jgi:hypothetical protein